MDVGNAPDLQFSEGKELIIYRIEISVWDFFLLQCCVLTHGIP